MCLLPEFFVLNRFHSILSVFHLNDNSLAKQKGDNAYDALHKLRPLLDKILQKFRTSYQLSEALTIDEGIFPFRGKISFKVYMPQKPNKYGLKIFMVADSKSGTCFQF